MIPIAEVAEGGDFDAAKTVMQSPSVVWLV